MQKTKILGVYKWATMGGVERVFLNRAHTIQKANINMQYDVFFFEDGGGKQKFEQYIKDNCLESVMRLVSRVEAYKYDYIVSIDTPEIIDIVEPEKLFFECHTSYEKHRVYLNSLPQNIRGIIVPSKQFKDELFKEVNNPFKEKLIVIPNTVYLEEDVVIQEIREQYTKKPVLYLGRLDKLKNAEELIELISKYNKIKDELFLILAGGIIEHEFDLNKLLQKYDMTNRTVYLPPVSFTKTWELLRIVKANQGIFMSASLKESFGLSVAEAMRIGIPVLILNNPAHFDLVKGDMDFLFESKQFDSTHSKIKNIFNSYSESCNKMINYSLSHEIDFVQSWKELFHISDN